MTRCNKVIGEKSYQGKIGLHKLAISTGHEVFDLVRILKAQTAGEQVGREGLKNVDYFSDRHSEITEVGE